MPSTSEISECPPFVSLTPAADRRWTQRAIELLQADDHRSADTHLIKLPFPALRGIDIYLKDESTHPTGSLKHRLARSLVLYGICNGHIAEGTTLVESSSGSTAVSEAYFAQLIGLPFVAVMPRSTSRQKVAAIERFGGRCEFTETASEAYAVAAQIAASIDGHYLDQFTFAERAIDWRGNNNIAESIFQQMRQEAYPVPHWVVMGAGTGGTSATIGRYIRYRNLATRLCVVDVEYSAFYENYCTGDPSVTCVKASRIEGIGRPRVELSFMPKVINHMIKVPDAASLAAMQVLSDHLFRRVGGSTGTNFFGLCCIAAHMIRAKEQGSLVSLICDSGDRYVSTYFDPGWLRENDLDIRPYQQMLEDFLRTGMAEALPFLAQA